MEWLLWIIIAVLVICIIGGIIVAIVLYSNYNECKTNPSPYCPQFTCPTPYTINGTSTVNALAYDDCVSAGLCPPNLTAPCSLQAQSPIIPSPPPPIVNSS